MSKVVLKNVEKTFNKISIIKDFNLEINSGEFIVLVGPSGCGKSTILRMIAGLEEVTSGTILINETAINDIAPSKRGVAMVFQSYALYPHMNVYANIAFSLKLAKTPKETIDKKVKEVAQILQLEELLDRLPKQLSGGQRQRVAIGRAIVRNPQVFLFDEPLSNLDASLRIQTRIEIERLHKHVKTTMIYVTHDQIEAMTLADKVVVLNGGNIEQVGNPTEIYNYPKNIFVAGFIGSLKMNFIDAIIKNQEVYIDDVKICDAPLEENTKVTVGVRPEHISIGNNEDYTIKGKIDIIEHLGEYSIYYVETKYGIITVKDAINNNIKSNDEIFLSFNQIIHIFDSNDNAVNLNSK